MEQLVSAAKQTFATTFAFYLKAQNYHWNVEGMFFKQLHDLFGQIYEEVYGSVDTFAEEIRALGTYTPGSFTRFANLSAIEDELQIPDAKTMLNHLYSDNNKVLELLNICFELANQNNQHGFADFLAGRIDAHRKHSWMLRATLK